jgi:V8-like Glu-specific endopeptidase
MTKVQTSHAIRNVTAPSTVEYIQYHNSIVKVSTQLGEITIPVFSGSAATGFAVDENHIITAGHFCAPLENLQKASLITNQILIESSDFNGNIYVVGQATVVAFSPKSPDLCLLKLKKHKLTLLQLANSTFLIQAEDRITVIGAPATFFPVRREGNIISLDATKYFPDHLANLLFLAVDIQKGSSGSPVIWNEKVIGIIVAMPHRLHSSALAEPIDTLHAFLTEHLKD